MLLDKIWVIGRLQPKPQILYYAPASNATDAWNNVLYCDRFGFGMNKSAMMRDGWRAMKVEVHLGGTK